MPALPDSSGLCDGVLLQTGDFAPGLESALVDLRMELRTSLEGVCAELRRQSEAILDVRASVRSSSGGGSLKVKSPGKRSRRAESVEHTGAVQLAAVVAGTESASSMAGSLQVVEGSPRSDSRVAYAGVGGPGSAASSVAFEGAGSVHDEMEVVRCRTSMTNGTKGTKDLSRRASQDNFRDWRADFERRPSEDDIDTSLGSINIWRNRLWRLKKMSRKLIRTCGGWVDFITGCMIVGNSLVIGMEIQNSLDGVQSPALQGLEHVFLVYFLFELSLRMLADEKGYLRSGWFVLEAVLVAAGIVGSWIVEPLLHSFAQDSDSVQVFDTFLILRILRVLRLVRALRLLEFFAELWKLCSGLLGSSKTVLSACFLVFITIYVFACLGIEAIASSTSLQEDPITSEIVQARFSSLPRAIMTLVSFTNADSISAVYEPIITANPAFAPFFACVWLFVTVSLMNLVTAVIVDTAISQSAADDEQKRHGLRRLAKKLVPEIEQLFDTLDVTKDGSLELRELDLTGVKLPADLKKIIEWDKLKDLFEFLDIDGSGDVDKEEFVDGIMHLILQSVPIETTQTLQLLRLQQKALVDLSSDIKEVRVAMRADGSRTAQSS